MIGCLRLIPMGDNREIVKIIYRHLKSSCTEPTELGTKHPYEKGVHLCLNEGQRLFWWVGVGVLC